MIGRPGIISEARGVTYSMFVKPESVRLKDDPFEVGPDQNVVETWMDLITPLTAEALAYYDHPHWSAYAAITRNRYSDGLATYIGCLSGRDAQRAGARVEGSRPLGREPELASP